MRWSVTVLQDIYGMMTSKPVLLLIVLTSHYHTIMSMILAMIMELSAAGKRILHLDVHVKRAMFLVIVTICANQILVMVNVV